MPYSILLLTPYLKSRRGNSLTAARLAAGLRNNGLQVAMVSMEDENWARQAKTILATQPVDILHGLNADSVASALADLPELNRLPLLITMTGTDLNFGITAAVNNTTRVMNQAQRLVVFNNHYLDLLGSYNQDWAGKTWVIPQGVQLDTAHPQHPRRYPDDTVFIIISGLRPVKNIEMALGGLAAAHRVNPHLRLMIVGSIIDQKYAGDILSRIGEQPWADYLGDFPHEEMAAVIRQADIVINTSHSEGQPQAVLEAMSMGLPCLLNAVPGNLGIINDGREGFYFTSVTELAQKALQLMENHPRCRAMGAAAQHLVNDRYLPEKEIAKYLDLYTEMLVSY